MRYALIALLAMTSLAHAQQPDKEFTVKINSSEIAVIGEALTAMPYGKVANLLAKLQAQINEQNLPKPTEVKPEEKK